MSCSSSARASSRCCSARSAIAPGLHRLEGGRVARRPARSRGTRPTMKSAAAYPGVNGVSIISHGRSRAKGIKRPRVAMGGGRAAAGTTRRATRSMRMPAPSTGE
jgi:hypothetical protein